MFPEIIFVLVQGRLSAETGSMIETVKVRRREHYLISSLQISLRPQARRPPVACVAFI